MKLSTISTSMASFAPYIQAFLSTVMKDRYKWILTESKQKKINIIMMHIWPHLLFIALGTCAILVGWYNPIDITTTFTSTLWTVGNMYLIFLFIKNGIADELT